MSDYIFNDAHSMRYQPRSGVTSVFDRAIIEQALGRFDETIRKIQEDIPVDVFEILGMRNLSAFVGEVFAAEVRMSSNGLFEKNPHQDGYPDLLLMDASGRALYDSLAGSGQLYAKQPFSPFANGGVEVKATCGSVPTPKQLAKRGLTKPQIGDERIGLLSGYDWKAHHRETNNLLSILWDFREKAPAIVGVFFCPVLEQEDWGKIVQPKAGGGRTTSVSIMNRGGIRKTYDHWVAVRNDARVISFLDSYNKSSDMALAAGHLPPRVSFP